MIRSIIFLFLFTLIASQRTTRIKLGDCPPPFVGLCSNSCYGDIQCSGQEKCCPTACGGTMCILPVTMRRDNSNTGKAGKCPLKPTGAWICSNTCSLDQDCRGRLKCCKGRCPGSMICTKPEI